jgi:hypothetical protein
VKVSVPADESFARLPHFTHPNCPDKTRGQLPKTKRDLGRVDVVGIEDKSKYRQVHKGKLTDQEKRNLSFSANSKLIAETADISNQKNISQLKNRTSQRSLAPPISSNPTKESTTV